MTVSIPYTTNNISDILFLSRVLQTVWPRVDVDVLSWMSLEQIGWLLVLIVPRLMLVLLLLGLLVVLLWLLLLRSLVLLLLVLLLLVLLLRLFVLDGFGFNVIVGLESWFVLRGTVQTMGDRCWFDCRKVVFVGFVINAGIFSVLAVVLFVGSERSEVVVVVKGWWWNVNVAALNSEETYILDLWI